MLTETSKYNDELELRQFAAFSNKWQMIGSFNGYQGMCIDHVLPMPEDAQCGVAKELLAQCLRNKHVISGGAMDIKDLLTHIESVTFNKQYVDFANNVGNELCEVMVKVRCPYWYGMARKVPLTMKQKMRIDDVCVTYFAAAREAGYNYGFFFVSLWITYFVFLCYVYLIFLYRWLMICFFNY